MRLSPNFELAEFVTSREASARGIDNTPPPAFIPNLKQVANALERVRSKSCLAAPHLHHQRLSAARGSIAAVGGSPQSAHMTGLRGGLHLPLVRHARGHLPRDRPTWHRRSTS
jgi:hypothetical protein